MSIDIKSDVVLYDKEEGRKALKYTQCHGLLSSRTGLMGSNMKTIQRISREKKRTKYDEDLKAEH